MIISAIIGILTILFPGLVHWGKWIISFVYITIYKRLKQNERFPSYARDPETDPTHMHFIAAQEERELESPFPEAHLVRANDELLFYAVNSKSERIVIKIVRSESETKCWLYLKLSNGKMYHLQETELLKKSYESGNSFTCGGLQVYYTCPMRRWRIFYSGLLRETSDEDNEGRLIFTKLAFMWKAVSDVYNATDELLTTDMCDAFSRVQWTSPVPPLKKLYECLDFYAQAGVITGVITVDEMQEFEIYLYGERIRHLGSLSRTPGSSVYQVLGSVPQNGMRINLINVSIPNVVDKFQFGYAILPNNEVKTLARKDIKYLIFPEDDETDIKASFIAGCVRDFKGCSRALNSPLQFQLWSASFNLKCMNFTLNDRSGSGIFNSCVVADIYKAQGRAEKIPSIQFPKTLSLVMKFSDDLASLVQISGGKGSSLVKLMKMSHNEQNFIVPDGIIVTTAAYEAFLTSEILEEIGRVADILYQKLGDAETACKKLTTIIENTTLPNVVCQSIQTNLIDIFGEDIHLRKFAVRSSATGEDTDVMSAAGQMETFLGVQGFKEIFCAVRKCWASQFSYIAVQYKRHSENCNITT